MHVGDIMMHVGGYYDACGGYQEYIRGCWGDTMSTAGDIMSTLGDVQYIGRISWCMWGSKLIKSFKFLLKTPMYWTSLDVLMISPRRTHDIMVSLWCAEYSPMYSWYPQCTEHPLVYSWYPPDVLMISPNVLKTPRYTHDIPPMYSSYPPMYSWCPPVFLNTPHVLNTHYTGWFWCRSCSKIGSLEVIKNYIKKLYQTTAVMFGTRSHEKLEI